MPKTTFEKREKIKHRVSIKLRSGHHDNFVTYRTENAEYIESFNKKGAIELIFKRKKYLWEKIVANLGYIVKYCFYLPKNIKNFFESGIPPLDLKAMFKERKEERLSGLGLFWSSPVGTFIFRISADAVALFLIIPLLTLRRRFYITDIPNVERLGHAVANIDILQAEINEGMYKTKGEERMLLVFYPQISEIEDTGFLFFNKITFIRKIAKCLDRKNISIIYIHPWFEKILKRGLVKAGSTFISAKAYGHRDILNVLCKTPSLFSLSRNDEMKCVKYFKEKNFKMDSPLVLVSNRSSGNINYIKSDAKSHNEHQRYGYRNSQFDNLVPSIQGLLGKGYNVIKVGASGGSYELSSDRYFDLSARPDSEKNILLDLFLFSRCLFFVGDTSGNYALAQAFRKPVCFVNFAPFGHFHSWDKNSLTIFKNIKNNRTGKLERFSDILKYAYGYEIHNDKAKKFRTFISNTKKEILETVNEMEARISGGSYKTDESIQKRFQKLFLPSYLHQSVNARCGDYFLKKYDYLLK